MTMTTSTTTKPAVTHPNWCDPDQCSQERAHGSLRAVNHRSPLSELTLTTPGAENSTLRIRAWLTQFDNYGEASVTRTTAVPFLDADGDADVSIDQLDQAGRWFTGLVAEYRAAAECADVAFTELSSRTVLDLGLTVGNGAGFVYMLGDWPSGDWRFTPDEARAFGHALIAQAARAEGAR